MKVSRRQFLLRAALAGSVPILGSSGTLLPAAATGRVVDIRPQEYTDAFANPLKGFRPDLPGDGGAGQGLDNPLVTLARHYIRWNQIEGSADDGVERILDFCNSSWAGVEKRNLKIIPRVYLYWPEKYYWPADLNPGEYGSRKFLYRLGRLVAKLGVAWNRDPRVAYIETGIVGPCGEQWGPTPHAELKRVLGDSFTAAFPDKLCMVRYPWQWPEYEFGVFWDSWGTRKDTARMLEALESPALDGSWKTRVRGGEISYGFGEPPGENPDDTMTKLHHVDWVECLARRGHWNHLGWVASYNWRNPVAALASARLQNAFGYRFVIEQATFPARLTPGQTFEVSFEVRNTGSSPFYYHWPVELSLLRQQDRQPVWRGIFSSADLRRWLPGDHWMQFADWDAARGHFVLDERPARYGVPAETVRASGRFTLPRNVRRGAYFLALSILDPAGQTPSCRFAIANYFSGGRHPMGRVGVGTDVGNPELDGLGFDDLATDHSLRYGAVCDLNSP